MKKLLTVALILCGIAAAQVPQVASSTQFMNTRTAVNTALVYLDTNKLQYAGTWSSSTTYTQSALVIYAGASYVSLAPGNLNNTPSSVSIYWGQLPGGAQVNSDWNAVSGAAQILNKPTIPPAQVNSDWNAVSGLSQILNKPSIYYQTVKANGTAQTQRSTFQLLNGANVTISCADNSIGLSTDCTINSAGGGTYPGAGLVISTGSVWGTSLAPGTAKHVVYDTGSVWSSAQLQDSDILKPSCTTPAYVASGTTAVNWSTAPCANVTMSGGGSTFSFTGSSQFRGILYLTDDSSSRTLSWPSNAYGFPTTTPGNGQMLTGYVAYDGTNYWASFSCPLCTYGSEATVAFSSVPTPPSGFIQRYADSTANTVGSKDHSGNQYLMVQVASPCSGATPVMTGIGTNGVPICGSGSSSGITFSIQMPLAYCTGVSTPTLAWWIPPTGNAAPTAGGCSGTNQNEAWGVFTTTGTPSAQYNLNLPPNLTGVADVYVTYSTATASGTFTLALDAICSATAGTATYDTAYSAGNFFAPGSSTAPATANYLQTLSTTGISWPASCAAGTRAHLRLIRTDTTGTASVLNVYSVVIVGRRTS